MKQTVQTICGILAILLPFHLVDFLMERRPFCGSLSVAAVEKDFLPCQTVTAARPTDEFCCGRFFLQIAHHLVTSYYFSYDISFL